MPWPFSPVSHRPNKKPEFRVPIDLWVEINAFPPNTYPPGNGYISHLGKLGKSSTQNAIFGGYVSSLEGRFLKMSYFQRGCSRSLLYFTWSLRTLPSDTADGSEIRQTHQLRLVVEIPLFTRVLHIQTVVVWDF